MSTFASIRSLILILATVIPALAATPRNCGCECCKGKEVCCCQPADAAAATERHALRGVVTRIEADGSALMVKHEAIAGVMPAMTMRFKAEPATIRTLSKGQAITATMVRRGDEWWLEDVKPAAPAT